MRVSFIVPWFGESLGGGAETLCHEFADRLHAAGHDVEVLTTCVREHDANWSRNHYASGQEVSRAGYPVRRFAVRPGDRALFLGLNDRLLAGHDLSYREELSFFENSINSDDLVEAAARRAGERALVALPYHTGIAWTLLNRLEGQVVLWPCFHDECYASMKLVAGAVQKAMALIFNTASERELAQRLYHDIPASAVIGMGLDAGKWREPFRGDDARALPYFAYVGRKSPQKGLPELLAYFGRFAEEHRGAELLVAGKGARLLPAGRAIRDLGFLDEPAKRSLLAGATALILPSRNESFSIVILEALACGTPVLVSGDCAVTRGHVISGNCGLYYSGYEEFAECAAVLLGRRDLRDALGANGAAYVGQHFRWDDKVRSLAEFLGVVCLLGE